MNYRNDIAHNRPYNKKISYEIILALEKISDNPNDVIPTADFIILCMPVSKYRVALDNIAPYVNTDKDIFLGVIYGTKFILNQNVWIEIVIALGLGYGIYLGMMKSVGLLNIREIKHLIKSTLK